ncbi:MAG TPA: hypothetical protein VF598_12430, partial [Hymenobacter sp.]
MTVSSTYTAHYQGSTLYFEEIFCNVRSVEGQHQARLIADLISPELESKLEDTTAGRDNKKSHPARKLS